MQSLNNVLKNLNLFDGQKEYKSIAFSEDWSNIFSFEIAEKLQDVIQPDAVYHFNNEPFILFFDFTENEKDDRINKFHSQVWCFDKAPIVFAVYSKNIEIYNAFKYENNKKLKQIVLNYTQINEKFNFWELQSGKTWNWLLNTYKRDFDKKNRINQKLFESIKALRNKLTNSEVEQLSEKEANILILRLIFSRYLIDRGVDISTFIQGSSLEQKKQCFNDLIANKNLLNDFFTHLKERFNGNLFDKEINVHETSLQLVSNIFKGDFATSQLMLFDIYDFNIIPVETISGIYESIIDDEKRKKNSAVYTPSFLVDYILTETVDKHLDVNLVHCKTLDPACGSGIFLVQTFRRIAFYTQKQKGQLSAEELCAIVKDNLYGVDRDVSALNVAIFSLYIAILDFIKPIEITNIQLPNLLGENLFRNDFFNIEDTLFDEEELHPYNEQFRSIAFDFILGNPPWGSKKELKHDRFHLEYLKKYPNIVSDYEISQSFILRTRDFSVSTTKCALIVISSAFHSLWAKKFSKYFFENYKVNTIFDMSAVRQYVFDADAPAIIAFYQYDKKNKNTDNETIHIGVKYNYYLDKFKKLVIDSQEIKKVKQRNFLKYDWLLKATLYGNKSDMFFIERLNTTNTMSIEDYIYQYKNSIFVGGGIQKNQSIKAKRFVPYLEGLPAIENQEVLPLYTGLDGKKIFEKEDCIISNGRIKELFYGSRILLKARPKKETYVIASYVENNSVFNEKIFAISSTTNKKDLKYLWAIFNSNLFSYYQFLTSISWGIFMPEISQNEYLNFPYIEPENKKALELLVDKIFELHQEKNQVDKIKEDNLLISINKIINEIYEIDEIEADLIDYTLNISRYEFQKGKQHFIDRQVEISELEKYAQLFLDHFSNYYYEDECEFFNIEIHHNSHFTAMRFIIAEQPTKEKIKFIDNEEITYRLLFNNFSMEQLSNDVFVQKYVKGFEEDGFYIIKPNQYKYWHRAIAQNDINEFMSSLLKSNLKKQYNVVL